MPLKVEVPCDGFLLRVEGRADGIINSGGAVTVDEIKGVLCELEQVKAPAGVHLAQAKCYAYIYGVQNEYENVSVQMTYCQMETEEIRQFVETFSIAELESWFLDVVKQYEKWAKFQVEWRGQRNASIKKD